ncbi:MAG TPA: hypothetical protein PKE31_19735 [Pseudomonadota bacterium]|jgi:hypothetical protein|nr:hypothetical protein [Pseudomonadota bacterium]
MSSESSDQALLYLQDLAFLIKARATEAKQDRESRSCKDLAYALGRLMAFHEVISLMQQQATAFGLPLTTLGLADIDPDRDLLR